MLNSSIKEVAMIYLGNGVYRRDLSDGDKQYLVYNYAEFRFVPIDREVAEAILSRTRKDA